MTLLWFVVLLAHMQSINVNASPVALVLLAAYLLFTGRLSTKVPGVIVALVLFTLYVVALVIANDSTANLGVVSWVAQYGRLLYLLVFLALMLCARVDRPMEATFYRGFTLAAGTVALMGLFTLYVHPLGGGVFTYGPFTGHNSLAGTLAPAVVLVVLRWLGASGERVAGWEKALGLVIVVTFFLSQSRGFTLGIAAAGAYAIAARLSSELQRRWLSLRTLGSLVAAPVAVFLMVEALSSRLHNLGADQNVLARFDLWGRAFDLFETSPLFGYGLGIFQQQQLATTDVIPGLVAVRSGGFYGAKEAFEAEGGLHVHDVYLQTLVEIGLVGALFLVVLFALAWRRATDVRGMGATDAWVSAHVYPALVVHLAVAGLTAGFTFTTPTMTLPLYFALARVWRVWGNAETLPSSPAGTERERSVVGRASGSLDQPQDAVADLHV